MAKKGKDGKRVARYSDDDRYRMLYIVAQADSMNQGCIEAGIPHRTIQNWLHDPQWRSFFDAAQSMNPRNQFYQLVPVLNRLYERLREAAWDRAPSEEVEPFLDELVEKVVAATEQIPDATKLKRRITKFKQQAAVQITGQLVDVKANQVTVLLDQISKVNAVLKQVGPPELEDGGAEDAQGDVIDPLGLER
jgi:hypothetical protein